MSTRLQPKDSLWTLREVPLNYFWSFYKLALLAVVLAATCGLLTPRNDLWDVICLSIGPAIILVFGPRIKVWYQVPGLAIVHIPSMFVTQILSGKTPLTRIDWSFILFLVIAIAAGSMVIWILQKMILGTPVYPQNPIR